MAPRPRPSREPRFFVAVFHAGGGLTVVAERTKSAADTTAMIWHSYARTEGGVRSILQFERGLEPHVVFSAIHGVGANIPCGQLPRDIHCAQSQI
jgi:phage tail protein X